MVARLAKQFNDHRRRVPPVGPIHEELNELAGPEARAVLIAPTETSSLPGDGGSPEALGNELERLYASLEAVTPDTHPRTARLLGASNRKVAQKVIEEAGEVALAAVKHNDRGIVRESADLLYHLAVLWRRAGIGPADVWAEMRRRADSLGIAEKRPKSKS
jgi:phosphoribosyl-ATP pyrophosphohydrolase